MKSHPKLGIHAVNVAQSLEVIESKSIVKILSENNLLNLRDKFLELSFQSKKMDQVDDKKTLKLQIMKNL